MERKGKGKEKFDTSFDSFDFVPLRLSRSERFENSRDLDYCFSNFGSLFHRFFLWLISHDLVSTELASVLSLLLLLFIVIILCGPI